MTCTLCNADLPKGEPVQRRTVQHRDSKQLDAPLCKACVYAYDEMRKRSEVVVLGLMIFGAIIFYGVCCSG